MSYMRLHRGNGRTGDYMVYPIYDMDTTYLPTVTTYSRGGYTLTKFASSDASSLQNLLPPAIPRKMSQTGNIITYNGAYEYNDTVNRYILPNIQLESVEIGQKPEDWDLNPQDYYTIVSMTPTSYNAPVNAYTPICDANQSPRSTFAWSSTTTYYHDITPDKYAHITQFFTTETGGSFGCTYTISADVQNDRLALRGLRGYVTTTVYGALGFYDITNRLTPDRDFYAMLLSDANALTNVQNWIMIFVHYDNIYGIACIGMSDSTDNALPVSISFVGIDDTFWGDSIVEGSPSQGGSWGTDTDRAGGQGTHTAVSDSRGDTTGATVGNIMTNRNTALSIAFSNPFMRTYTFDNLSNQQISEIFAILYGTDYWSMFANQMLNPLSSIVAFHLIPSTLRGSNLTLEDLIIGPKNFSAAMLGTPQVTTIKQVAWYHVGSVNMSDVLLPYFDAYPDFAPYTDIILHLPYIGDIKIDVNAVMYGSLSVEYCCDNVSGNVAAWIYCQDRYDPPHCQYKYVATGNCAYSIPLYAQSQNGLDVGKIIGSGVGIVGGALTGNIPAAISGALSMGSALYEHSRAPITTQSTGGSAGNVSILCDNDVWIEVIRQQWVQPANYQDLVGIPSGIAGTLEEIGAYGRIVCSAIETDGIAATEPELREIERLMQSGVWIKPQI